MSQLMPRFSALQVCPAADLNELAAQIELDVQATPTDISPTIRNTAVNAPSAAKVAIKAFGVTAIPNGSGFIDVGWPAMDGVSSVVMTPTAGNSAARSDIILVANVINLNGMSVKVLNPRTNSTSALGVVTTGSVSFSVLVVGWILD